MTEREEREIEQLNKGRLLRDASAELLPLLSEMREAAISKITASFRAGELSSLTGHAAELATISELAAKITRNNKETAKREEKLFHEHE